MWQFLKHPDFTLVVPSAEDAPAISAQIQTGSQKNARWMEAHPERPTGGRLGGSFIYSHPPDYIGRPTVFWNRSQWQEMLHELKDMGLDTVIYQAAAWVEVRECSYPSRLLKGYTAWDSLEPLCEAVMDEGMTLFLGGLGNLSAFDESASEDLLQRDRDQQLAVFEELVSLYRGGFHGFYMSPETAFPGRRQPERERRLNRYFKEVCQGVKSILEGIPILASPATFYSAGKEEEVHDFLYFLLEDVPIDYMTPQDSIGTFGNHLETLEASFKVWQQLGRELGFHLWVNVESFQRYQVGTAQDFLPADFKRLAHQLANAYRVGEKIVSWEVPYFYSPMAGEAGMKLRRDYLDSIARGER